MLSNIFFLVLSVLNLWSDVKADGVVGCGGFVKSDVDINFSLVEVKLYTPHGSIKYQTDCAPNTGYYLIPLYDKGDYILKVEPPKGWSFEPESMELHVDGTTDKCSQGEDINFRFTGFSLNGMVISKGQTTGPAGVSVTLSSAGSKDVLQTVKTAGDGSYSFSQVLPGDYDVRASMEGFRFQTSETRISVTNDNLDVGSALLIAGYSVTGKVLSEGEPIKGVNFLLYSTTAKPDDVSDCITTRVPGMTEAGEQPLCHVVSGADGKFVFPCVATGEYQLVPFYKGEHITFDVVPETLTVQVAHRSQVLQSVFQVEGFSVSGRVLVAEKVGLHAEEQKRRGSGVGQAKVILNGKPAAVTGVDGQYHLENIKTGQYKLQVETDNIKFNDLSVKITPNTPQLPDILASSFSVCGHVSIDQIPEGLPQTPSKRRLIIHPDGKGSEAVSIVTDEKGAFCSFVKPGKHVVKVHVSDVEVKSGLHISPSEKVVMVTDRPVLDVKFSQFRAKVSGSVTCIEKCGMLEVQLDAVGRTERQIVPTRDTQKAATFSFDNVMPGKYKVTLLRDSLCWKEKTLEIEVINENVANLSFQQTGYILKCTISHAITLNFAHDKKEGSAGSFELNKGKNRFCLAQPGVYKLTPNSCHKFEKDVYTYDTAAPETLTLTAIKHIVHGSVKVPEPVADMVISIKSSLDKTVQTLGPLELPSKPGSSNETKPDPTAPVYQFSHWARSGEQLQVSVQSAAMLYTPTVLDAFISGDTCPGELLTFTGKKGLFIAGSIKPALAGVIVTVTSVVEGKMEPVVIETDEKGQYRVGPLHSHLQYEVQARKEGYVLAKDEGDSASFRAFKLGKVAVKIVDEEDAALSDVLLSLSGGKQYRSNNITKDDGSMVFADLSPGQYFLRPMMKEYKFDPASQMIDVLEGTTMDIKIKGVRVAFSCYGLVTSLNGEPEPGVVVEALGKDDCSLNQEESKTDQSGQYRIRGLQPKCSYEVRLKIGEMNRHIERAAPKSRLVAVDNADFTGVNIIAFRRMNQMDISGNVITSPEFLSSLKVRLYRDDNPGMPIHTVSLGVVSFFYLPSLQIDDQVYTVRLESSLSKTTHEFNQPELSFDANVSYKHITFKFDPKRKSLDQEIGQGSILVLPLTMLAIFAAYNYQKLLPMGLRLVNQVQEAIANRQGAGDAPPSQEVNVNDSPISRKKNKPRKT